MDLLIKGFENKIKELEIETTKIKSYFVLSDFSLETKVFINHLYSLLKQRIDLYKEILKIIKTEK